MTSLPSPASRDLRAIVLHCHYRCVAVLAACLIASVGLAAEQAKSASDPLAPEKFFIQPDFESPKLSPDGAHLSFRTGKADYSSDLTIANLANDRPLTKYQDRFYWSGAGVWLSNGRLLVEIGNSLVSIDPDTGKEREIADYADSFGFKSTRGRLLRPLHNRPNHVMVAFGEGDYSGIAKQWTLLEVDGTAKENAKAFGYKQSLVRKLSAPPGNIVSWYYQPDGEVRACAVYDDKKTRQIFWRPNLETELWQPVEADWERISIVGIARNGRDFLVTTRAGEKTNGLYRLDASTGKLGDCLFRDPAGSMIDAVPRFSPTGSLVGLHYRRDTSMVHWFDPNFEAIQSVVDQRLPDSFNQLVDWSDDISTVLIHVQPIGDPGSMYLLDMKQRRLRRFATCNPELDRSLLSPTRVFNSTSHDGRNLQSFLITPKSASREKPCPMIVFFDAPSWPQTRFGYFAEGQWLAAQGIAVLTISPSLSLPTSGENQASGPYDPKAAAQRRIEIVQTVLQTDTIDPKRVGLFASSGNVLFALETLSAAPGLFRCAAMFNGLFTHEQYSNYLKLLWPYESPEGLAQRLAEVPDSKIDLLATQETLPAAARPKFFLGWDERVSRTSPPRETFADTSARNAAQEVAVLKQHGIPFQTAAFERRETIFETNIARWKAVQRFLKENL